MRLNISFSVPTCATASDKGPETFGKNVQARQELSVLLLCSETEIFIKY